MLLIYYIIALIIYFMVVFRKRVKYQFLIFAIIVFTVLALGQFGTVIGDFRIIPIFNLCIKSYFAIASNILLWRRKEEVGLRFKNNRITQISQYVYLKTEGWYIMRGVR